MFFSGTGGGDGLEGGGGKRESGKREGGRDGEREGGREGGRQAGGQAGRQAGREAVCRGAGSFNHNLFTL